MGLVEERKDIKYIAVVLQDGTSYLMTEPILGFMRHYINYGSLDNKEEKPTHQWLIEWTEIL